MSTRVTIHGNVLTFTGSFTAKITNESGLPFLFICDDGTSADVANGKITLRKGGSFFLPKEQTRLEQSRLETYDFVISGFACRRVLRFECW